MPRASGSALAGVPITRRDFLNATLLGAGAALLTRPAPGLAATATGTPAADEAWYGYGGIGDYASSHGNTPAAVRQAHAVRDGAYDALAPEAVADTAERYEVVIVGAGLAGLGAALEYRRAGRKGPILLIDNHPLFGGEAKRNEFLVAGERLVAPQGSNGFSVPGEADAEHAVDDALYYDLLGVPRGFDYVEPTGAARELRFGSDNYGFLYWLEHTASVGYFFEELAGGPARGWVRDPWSNDLAGTPYSTAERRALLDWRRSERRPQTQGDFRRWLDTMSYRDYVEKVLGYGRHVTRHADPILASAAGGGCDTVSAYAAYAIVFPGMLGFIPPEVRDFDRFERHSFPGGNDGFARLFLKRVLPEALAGGEDFASVLNGSVRFEMLDRAGAPVRLRLGATAVRVEHEAPTTQAADAVRVTYVRDGRLERVRAGAVVMASGAWINRHVVHGLPADQRAAMARFEHAPFLVANVALTNWRFMADLGITACRYEGDFGFSCNIRRPMRVGDYAPPLDPDRPTVLTFYVPFIDPGRPLREQVTRGRAQLLATDFATYERRILAQLQRLFGRAFDARRDVAGIVLNRWGHALVVPEPGFYFGRAGAPPDRELAARPFGRVSFGHSELRGNQHWGPAAAEGARAMREALAVL